MGQMSFGDGVIVCGISCLKVGLPCLFVEVGVFEGRNSNKSDYKEGN
jgi:hypothetical protein